MTGRVHEFDGGVGYGYGMSLFYPHRTRRTAARARRVKTVSRHGSSSSPPDRIVEAIAFDTANPAFRGEMIIVVTLEDRDGGTDVTILFENIPPGTRPENNDAGTRSSLEKLARYVEQQS